MPSWKIHSTNQHDYVGVMLLEEGRSKGIAQTSLFCPIDQIWYVNRVLVTMEGERGQGLGGMLLDRMISGVVDAHGKILMVEPGGYNADPKRQQRFYESHDFIKTPSKGSSGFHWRWISDPERLEKLASRLLAVESQFSDLLGVHS
jgi:GNAT superfamily N-acetyltransferase